MPGSTRAMNSLDPVPNCQLPWRQAQARPQTSLAGLRWRSMRCVCCWVWALPQDTEKDHFWECYSARPRSAAREKSMFYTAWFYLDMVSCGQRGAAPTHRPCLGLRGAPAWRESHCLVPPGGGSLWNRRSQDVTTRAHHVCPEPHPVNRTRQARASPRPWGTSRRCSTCQAPPMEP